jgi:predicted Rossmann fold nucleotide-binding protein DprA/Smf involved in DNA uptake
LDCVYGAGVRCARAEERSALSSEASRLLRALGDERPTGAALEAAGIPAARGLGVLAELELGGWIRRRPGGSFTVIP